MFDYPLNWPTSWKRTEKTITAPFGAGWTTTMQDLEGAIKGLKLANVAISTNWPLRGSSPNRQAKVTDPGVAMYFERNGIETIIPCDKFNTVEGNLRAISLTLEYMRRMEKYGTSQTVDAAFRGFAALPASIQLGGPQNNKPWHEVLELLPTSPHPVIRAAYRTLSAKYHPDNGETGDPVKFGEVQRAYKESGAA